MRWVSALLILFIGFLSYHFCESRHDARSRNKEDREQVIDNHFEPAPVTSKPQSEKLQQPNSASLPDIQNPSIKKEQQEDPYQTDPFTKRKLDLPMPKSITELLAKMNSYEMPKLPVLIPGRPVQRDGQVLTYFSGFYESQGGNLRKVMVSRVGGGPNRERVEVKLEEGSGDYRELSTDANELTVKNFNDDRYSLVIGLPDGRLFYFKFFDNQSVPNYGGTRFRVLKGWLLSKTAQSAQLGRVALIDHWDQAEWPRAEAIQKLFPDGSLPK